MRNTIQRQNPQIYSRKIMHFFIRCRLNEIKRIAYIRNMPNKQALSLIDELIQSHRKIANLNSGLNDKDRWLKANFIQITYLRKEIEARPVKDERGFVLPIFIILTTGINGIVSINQKTPLFNSAILELFAIAGSIMITNIIHTQDNNL